MAVKRLAAKDKAPRNAPGHSSSVRTFFKTKRGTIYHGDSQLLFRRHIKPASVDLIVTSPPFGLIRKKDYGNVDADDYLIFEGCATGPALGPPASGCEPTDMDDDNDVDQGDFAMFQRCLSGENVAGDPDCLQ